MIDTFIRRPVFTTMFILVLIVFGIRSYPGLGVDLYPDVDLPMVGVTVTYEGTAPEEMETLVTKPIENRVRLLPFGKDIPRRCWSLKSVRTPARWPVRFVKK